MEMLTIKDAATRIGVKSDWLYRWAAKQPDIQRINSRMFLVPASMLDRVPAKGRSRHDRKDAAAAGE